MMVVVSYDVAKDKDGIRRLRKVAKVCENYGQRVQDSVFECLVEPVQFISLKDRLKTLINNDFDSIRFYLLGSNWKNRIEHMGIMKAIDPEDPMVI